MSVSAAGATGRREDIDINQCFIASSKKRIRLSRESKKQIIRQLNFRKKRVITIKVKAQLMFW